MNFDELLRTRLRDTFDEPTAMDLISAYEKAKSDLRKDVFEEIRAVEPNLTDHGPRHVENVQQNALKLAPPGIDAELTPIELYFLGMITLFHDAGNVFGRKDHRDKVGPVYARIRGEADSNLHERTLLLRATRAHTGHGRDGSLDTLQDLQSIDHLRGEAIRLQELAAILRLADELAEGPQRTSAFRKRLGLYTPEATPFHSYASTTNILIDRPGHRIAIAYEIKVPDDTGRAEQEIALRTTMEFIYERVIKANQERQYARYYSDLLAPFRRTEVTFNFHYATELLDLDIAPLRLTDIVVPGDVSRTIPSINPTYALESLIPRITQKLPESATNGNR